MFQRILSTSLHAALTDYPAVALLGARQVGKTTLARQIAETMTTQQMSSSVYLDIERPSDRRKLSDPEAYLSSQTGKLIIMDEVQHMPEVFPVLRSLIDENRRADHQTRFLLLGSASGDLLRQSGESLAGRIAYLELTPLQLREIEPPTANDAQQQALWLRGGFPRSYLATSAAKSLDWRSHLISTYIDRDLPSYGARLPAQTLRRLWTMLAHNQGSTLEVNTLARNLMIDTKSVHRYLDMLVDLMLLRKLQPWYSNLGKRLVKTPKIYVRDSGLLHALLGIQSHDDLLSHPVVGQSWEGFAIEALLNAAPKASTHGFYRTSNGAEIDLVLDVPGQGLHVVEIKKAPTSKPKRGFYSACEDLKPSHKWLLHAGNDSDNYPVGDGVQAVSLRALIQIIGKTFDKV